MKNLINKMLNAAKKYSIWDFGCLKIALISLGILFGTYFSQFFLRNVSIMWAIFIVTFVWILYRTFKKFTN